MTAPGEFEAAAVLLATGLVMGAINNLAGAAGALGLVALEIAAGLDPVQANASLRPAALAIGLAGWLGFRSRGRPVPGRAWRYGLLTVPGAAVGAVMAVTLPAWVYRSVLAAILLAVLAQQFGGVLRPKIRRDPPPPWTPWLFVLVGLHMGFVQVATGLLSLLVLGIAVSRDLVVANAAKMAIVIASSATAVACLAVAGAVAWLPAAVLAAGAGLGSFLASRWSVDKGHGAVRIVVLAITITVLVRLGWQLAAA